MSKFKIIPCHGFFALEKDGVWLANFDHYQDAVRWVGDKMLPGDKLDIKIFTLSDDARD